MKRRCRPGTYRIRLQGVERVRDRLIPDRVLVLLSDGVPAPEGLDVHEPVYGAPARWIRPDQQEDAALSGLTVVSPTEVLATHLLEVLKDNLSRLLSLARAAPAAGRIHQPVRSDPRRGEPPACWMSWCPTRCRSDLLHAVLRLLLEERVSIRNLPLILEAIAEARRLGSAEAICEHVRQRLGFQIVAELKRPDGTIPLIQLAPDWERTFANLPDRWRARPSATLPCRPDLFAKLANGIAERVNRAAETGVVSGAGHLGRAAAVPAHGGAGQGAAACRCCPMRRSGLEARPALLGQVPA